VMEIMSGCAGKISKVKNLGWANIVRFLPRYVQQASLIAQNNYSLPKLKYHDSFQEPL